MRLHINIETECVWVSEEKLENESNESKAAMNEWLQQHAWHECIPFSKSRAAK